MNSIIRIAAQNGILRPNHFTKKVATIISSQARAKNEIPFKNVDAFIAITQWLSHTDHLTMRQVSHISNNLIEESLRIILTPNDLSSLIPSNQIPCKNEKIEFAENNNLKIKITEIITANDAEIVIKFIKNPENLHLLQRLEVIELATVNLKNMTAFQQLLNLLAKTSPQLKHLSSLICRDIDDKAILTIDGIQGIHTLTIRTVYDKAKLTIRNLPEVKSIFCKSVNFYATLTIHHLDNLNSIVCGSVFQFAIINLDHLKNLKSISFEDIMHDANLSLTNLDQLTTLTFQDTYPGSTLTLNNLSNLHSLIFRNIYHDTTFLFHQLDKLTSFLCEKLMHSAKLELITLNNLRSFICSNIYCMATLSLPSTLDNLSIEEVDDDQIKQMVQGIQEEIQRRKEVKNLQ